MSFTADSKTKREKKPVTHKTKKCISDPRPCRSLLLAYALALEISQSLSPTCVLSSSFLSLSLSPLNLINAVFSAHQQHLSCLTSVYSSLLLLTLGAPSWNTLSIATVRPLLPCHHNFPSLSSLSLYGFLSMSVVILPCLASSCLNLCSFRLI